jgi:RsiW-degrading membrane proteinase PrsW (M82 family)
MAQATPENSETAPTAGDEAAAKASASQATSTLTAHAAQNTAVQLPQSAPAEVQAATATTPQVIFDEDPRHRRGRTIALTIAGIVLGIALLLVLAYFLIFIGPGFSFVGAILALVPLTFVLLGVRWIDRWEPEPRLLLLIAFLWGATASIAIALLVDVGASLLRAAGGADVNTTQYWQIGFQAPIVEEIAKGLGVLLIYLLARRYFDGPVDGIVFAALVAGGFAFTENIQYFAIQIAESGTLDVQVGQIFFIRGILSPFAHVMFTGFIGFFIGLAARKGTTLGGVGMFFVGLVPAIILHGFWNQILFYIYSDLQFYIYYLLVQVPLFILAIVAVVLLRRREAKMTQLRLGEYAAAGWFNTAEVNTLGTGPGRRQAMGWAKTHGLGPVMKEYIKDATHLAFTRNRIVSGRDRIGSQADEALLLHQVQESRARLSAATPVGRGAPVAAPAPPAG